MDVDDDSHGRQRSMREFFAPRPSAQQVAVEGVPTTDGAAAVAESAGRAAASCLEAGATRVELHTNGNNMSLVAERPGPLPPAKKPKRTAAFTKDIACMTQMPTPRLTIAFADVLEDAFRGVGDNAFTYARAGARLAGKGEAVRGAIAEACVRRAIDTDVSGTEHTVDAATSTRSNGTQRNRSQTEYDFGVRYTVAGEVRTRRCEAKLSRMSFVAKTQTWSVKASGGRHRVCVKQQSFLL